MLPRSVSVLLVVNVKVKSRLSRQHILSQAIRDDGAVFNPYDVYQYRSTCVCQDGSSALNALFRDWRSLDFDIDMVVQLESIYPLTYLLINV